MSKQGTPPGLRAALRALGGRRGQPTDYDRPPVTPAPGPKRKPLPGQLDLAGNEVPGLPEPNALDSGAIDDAA